MYKVRLVWIQSLVTEEVPLIETIQDEVLQVAPISLQEA
jgi:hypothetical protein